MSDNDQQQESGKGMMAYAPTDTSDQKRQSDTSTNQDMSNKQDTPGEDVSSQGALY
jgi:hypothetical protein